MKLEPHPIYSVIVAEIADRVIAGESLGSICRWLDAEGIPTPRNVVRQHKGRKPVDADAQWLVPSLTKILKSRPSSAWSPSTPRPAATRP